ncbi:hypothetical protein RYA05_02365 [Pseudomonas syringae pv. actinidiae]|nr:hypothetical protein [Pseudomonas syringae pv. actinidiae]
MITVQMLKDQLALETDWVIQHKLEYAIGAMKNLGLEEIAQIGNFIAEGIDLPRAGDHISLPKGIAIRSTMPGDKAKKVCKRTYMVSVSRIHSGFFRGDDSETAFECQSTIVWAGEGGYWHSVNTRDWIKLGGAIISRKVDDTASVDKKVMFTVMPMTKATPMSQ